MRCLGFRPTASIDQANSSHGTALTICGLNLSGEDAITERACDEAFDERSFESILRLLNAWVLTNGGRSRAC